MKVSAYRYPPSAIEGALLWVANIQNSLPPHTELNVLGRLDPEGRQTLEMRLVAMEDTDEIVDHALDILDTCPVREMAYHVSKGIRVVLPGETEGDRPLNPTGSRYYVDGIWTNEPADTLVPLVRRLFEKQPTPLSYILWMFWGKPQQHDDMAFSVEGNTYLSPCGLSNDQAEDPLD